ncbi:MAG: hypothetical protein E7103_13110 [Prevotella sp.]|nr:hypothetical protein [Prevotella sp.]
MINKVSRTIFVPRLIAVCAAATLLQHDVGHRQQDEQETAGKGQKQQACQRGLFLQVVHLMKCG